MKTINLLLVAALTLFTLPALADSTPSQPAPSLANQTASIAKSTLGMAQDTAITTYIYAKLASHPDLSNANLDISTNGGKVVLNGIVNDDSQAKEIRQIAESTSGVKSVDASKIIISQPDNALYVKTSSSQPVTQTSQAAPQAVMEANKSAEPVAQPEMQVSSADPLLTNPVNRVDEKEQLAPKMKKHIKTVQLSKNIQKHKLHATAKHKPKKKTLQALRTPKHKHLAKKETVKHKHLAKKEAPKKKMLAHHKKNKAFAKHHPKHSEKHLAKQAHHPEKSNKPQAQVASHKNNNESVDQMTNDFLKTALMANKSIPEE